MKKILLLSFAAALSFNTAKSQSIINARNAAVGSNVTVRGVVINSSELGIIRYVQDNTGGIAAYGSNLSSVNKGDSVIINGTLTQYNNLFEINPVTFTVVVPNVTVPAPNVITPAQFSESVEGTLIKIMNCSFGASAGGIFPSTATNYTVTSNGQPFAVRTNTFLSGTSIPSGTVNIAGVGSQFCSSPTSGCTNGYQLLLRTNTDLTTTTTNTTTTGIEEHSQSNSVFVYPNPASGSINFRLSSEEPVTAIFITTTLGNTVYATKENISSIDLNNFADGLYNLTILTKSGNYKTKFVVSK